MAASRTAYENSGYIRHIDVVAKSKGDVISQSHAFEFLRQA